MTMKMIEHMADLNAANLAGLVRTKAKYMPQDEMKIPNWI